jgi:fructoselysine 6-kinase
MAASPPIRLASIGDFCVDYYVDGTDRFMGGTAFNVAVQARRAGAQASVLSAIGSDDLGSRFLGALNALQINTERLQQREGKTSRVFVRLDANKTPDFYDWDFGVLENFELTQADRAFLMAHHAASSILLVGLERQFEQFCAFDLPNTLKVADFAGGSRYSISTDAISRYISQLDIVIRSVQDANELEALERISKDHKRLVIGTMGKAGSVAFLNDDKYVQPSSTVEAVDTTGAGDAYIAQFVVAYLRTKDVQESMRRATQAAVEAVLERGATSEELGDGEA